MRPRRGTYNPKRRMASPGDPDHLLALRDQVGYGGNPEHKRSPGDFGLTPPSQPRPDKSLCDEAGIRSRAVAVDLLHAGVERGLISEQTTGGFPQNVWAVTDDGIPLEAQLENRELGTYHGYPIPANDPFGREVLLRWNPT